MKLTTKGRYAVTAMLDLALHTGNGPVALADISERQAISLSYLEQLFARVRKRGLVASTRGPGGGYALNKRAADISVADVIAAVDESVDTTSCGGTSSCHDGVRCLTHDLWTDLSCQIQQFLRSISLQDLMDRKDVQNLSRQRDAIILQRLTDKRNLTGEP
ncbi:MAG: Fe-S cluster assembly transcriptional regulator IscR [Gammaproteobacteria bacterium]|nr:MAG: Fe-S cluster assembly transcriptional regulator IscR [Gammaproteobacteria bacterium]